MTTRDEEELEQDQTWDLEQPQVRRPAKTSRVVVSVAFRREDFDRVSEYAERAGKKVSEFIREAAIEMASGHGSAAVYGSGGTGAQWWVEQMPANTRGWATPVESPQEAATTH